MRVTPINMAEAVFEPFWDSAISEISQWNISDGSRHGLKVYQWWCNVCIEWAGKAPAGANLEMEREYPEGIDVSGYDDLILSVLVPKYAITIIEAQTDKGTFRQVYQSPLAVKAEHALDLQGANKLFRLKLIMEAQRDEEGHGWLNWIGLQNRQLLKRYTAQWDRFDDIWEGYLQPKGYHPSFRPAYGIAITPQELDSAREIYRQGISAGKRSPLVERAAAYQDTRPEGMIREYTRFWDDTRFDRVREDDTYILGPCYHLAMAAMLTKDEEMLRLAARYAMALCMIPNWDDGFITHFPMGPFEHRCFVTSRVLFDLAYILDVAGDMFTAAATELIQRRLMEEGMGSINFNAWKHEYIFSNNQLSWFSSGRLLAYAVLFKTYPRIKPYMDLAYQDVCESMEKVILPDGGSVEGPNYFMCQPHDGGEGVFYYSRVMEKPFRELLPAALLRSADYGDALYSTADEGGMLPVCDNNSAVRLKGVAFLAYAMPDSIWTTLFRSTLKSMGGMPDELIIWQLERGIPPQGPAPKAFTYLPAAGYMSSVRQLAGETVKLFVMGNLKDAGHTHEDKGSFILEFAGDIYAMDSGTCEYGDSFSLMLKYCQYHNMLIPQGIRERPAPLNPLPYDVKPEGSGDGRQFHASIDATPGWEKYYAFWKRSFDSASPEELQITDSYALKTGTGTAFHWLTMLPVEIIGGKAVIHGRRSRMEITCCGAVMEYRQAAFTGGRLQNRLLFIREGLQGEIQVQAKLFIEK